MMKADTLLVAWQAAGEDERKAIVTALQAIADEQGEAVKWSGIDRLSKKPVVEVFAAAREAERLVVRFIYDFRIGRWAQSGSDWDEHHIHAGSAIFCDGALVSHLIEPEMITIIEYACDTYDEAPAVNERRARAIASLSKPGQEG
jgi:hypothetical protein